MQLNIKALLKENWGFVLFILAMFACRSSFADWYHVPTGSMQPTIEEGDRIFVNKMAYRLELPFTDIAIAEFDTPQRGDIVVFVSEAADNRLVKRVIGVPGDEVAMIRNQLIINGNRVHLGRQSAPYDFEEQLFETRHAVRLIPNSEAKDSFDTVVVPEGHYLVMGDNRNNSADSRYYGFVPAKEIQGKATKVLLSLDAQNYYLPKMERFLEDLI